MNLSRKKGLARLTASINNSWQGFKNALSTEEAFRQLIIINSVLLVIILFLPVPPLEKLLLIACSFLLLVVELLNTAIETVVDRISSQIHPLSKRAKDISGAAQLVAVTLTILVWTVVLVWG
ncbi:MULTISPECIES: diacylglycerol kinase [Tatumella]|uniref:Diacylglycerol kinase n=1 Tax=Tatumella punctata TaxID=399969 RepID=A0ABW1VT23_9GAMM|nr:MULTISPECIES: diacylglycerol kinase [unclassified Tatumella]MBS0856039.1 diacylglycerol kinase [Tatumella sp. JGM16]MBS0878098.1 diacylglycerol kinase [Tatumella sp. JGM82]MBS0890457.1 diacylglycerol kinase [Tatumella sp. JGM94]MBS0894654.1 diacylglycerol kinase [Tatumella sp. JGM130]MBS0900913.1 diacylglycerol kinase [Tatumella sp. JGM100]